MLPVSLPAGQAPGVRIVGVEGDILCGRPGAVLQAVGVEQLVLLCLRPRGVCPSPQIPVASWLSEWRDISLEVALRPSLRW